MTKKANYQSRVNTLSKLVTENKVILLIIFSAFLLRFPTLFEPLLNDRETYLVTYATNLLPRGASVTFIELPLVAFDHKKILDYALQRLKWKFEYTTVAFSLLQKEFTQSQRATMSSLNAFVGSIVFGIASVTLGVLADRFDARTALIITNVVLLIPLFFYRKIFLHERGKGASIQTS